MTEQVFKPSDRESRLIDSLVVLYQENQKLVSLMLEQLVSAVQGSDDLMNSVHSLRWRTKNPDHLKDSLLRKMGKCKSRKEKFLITKDNLFEKVTDLAGLRILHLHTEQIIDIDKRLRDIFLMHRYEIIEEPCARTWDDEYRKFYDGIGIKHTESENMYTSVHYVVAPNTKTKITCEIQVRTLAEEVWGEVDHSFNYPHKSEVLACREQIKVLARVTSSCTRLVDAIYRTAEPLKAKVVKAKVVKAKL